LLLNGQARVLLADTCELTQTAHTVHDTSPVCTAALGRLLTGAVLMGAQLKNEDERVSLDIQADGPAGRAMAVADLMGHVKGYIANPQADLPPRGEKLDVGGALGSDGFLTVIRGQSGGEPYVGKCRLTSGEVAEDIAGYYFYSEQTPSLVSLGVMVGPQGQVLSSGGLFIQPLPDCPEELISELELRSPVYADLSRLLLDSSDLEDLAMRLFAGLDPELIGETRPRWRCDCGRDRIEQVLLSLGAQELLDMIEKDHKAEIHCHFCNTTYAFTGEELRSLYAQIAGSA